MHKYFLINRPPSIGTHPAGEADREVWSYRHEISSDDDERVFWAYGSVTYPEPLDFEQVWRYELMPANDDERDRYYDWRDEEGK